MPYVSPHFYLFDIQIDPQDQHLLNYKWLQNNLGFYTRTVKREINNRIVTKVLSLHREILGITGNTLLIVEFVNNDKNDLRRANLKVITSSQAQLKKAKAKGYTQLKNNKFAAQISIHGYKHYLGCFGSAIEASQTYTKVKEQILAETVQY